MMLKGRTSGTFLIATFLVLDFSLFSQLVFYHAPTGFMRGRGASAPVTVPVAGGLPILVQRVYVKDILDLRVVQQPKDDAYYVSPNAGELTQFGSISQYGNIGLLAHNYLEGGAFSLLEAGHEVSILYSDGKTETFIVTEILRYRALEPKSPFSSFQNLNREDDVLSVGQMVDRVYKGERHLTFQTCISRFGNSSWGRLFVLAVSKPESVEAKAQPSGISSTSGSR